MTAPAETAPVDPTAPATPPTPAPPAPSPANMPAIKPSAAAAPTADKGDDGDEPKQPSREEKELARARKEAATYREQLRDEQAAAAAFKESQATQMAEAESLKEVLAKLNAVLNPDANQPPDPAQLAEQLTAAQAETALIAAQKDEQIKQLTIRASLPAVLSKASADPALTEAVLTASGALGKLDPASPTFAADLESAVAAAMEANPRLKVDAPVAPSRRSGAEIPGRSGGSNQLTLEQVRSMKPADIDKARKAGQLTGLGIGAG